MMFLEFHADHGIDYEVEFCRNILESHSSRWRSAVRARWIDCGARGDFGESAIDAYDPDRVQYHPGDVTVTLSRYADGVRFAQELETEYGFPMAVFGHAGDGNIHYVTLANPDDPEELTAAEEMYKRMLRFAIDCGGTVTGEHGIGRGKRAFLRDEHGEAVTVMHRIKDAFDPKGIMNTGKHSPLLRTTIPPRWTRRAASELLSRGDRGFALVRLFSSHSLCEASTTSCSNNSNDRR